MQNSAEIIEAVRAVLKARIGSETISDYAVAKALHISPQAMSHRRHRRVHTLDDQTANRAADLLGVPRGELLAIVHAEKCDLANKPDAAATWRNLAAILKTGQRAAAVAGFFLAGALLSGVSPKTAYAGPGGALPHQALAPSVVYYVKSLAGLFWAFLGLFRNRPRPVFA